MYLKHQQKIHIFPVDSVFIEEETGQSSSYDIDRGIYEVHMKRSVNKLMEESTNLWVFSGGQTFSGKEECLFGDRLKGSLVLSTIESIFSYIEQDESRDFVLRVSWFEFYNETCHDLLAIHSMNSQLKVKSPSKVIDEVCSTLLEVVALWNLSVNNKNNLNAARKKEYRDTANIRTLHVS